MNMRTLLTLVLVSLSCSAHAGVQGSDYASIGTCGVFPRADLKTPTGSCVGIVAGPAQGLQMPRTLLEISDGTFLVVDMAGWGKKSGRVLKMRVLQNGVVTLTPLISNLNQPHGIALGPDKKVYAINANGRASLTRSLSVTPAKDKFKSEFLFQMLLADFLPQSSIAAAMDKQLSDLRDDLARIAECEENMDDNMAGCSFVHGYGHALLSAGVKYLEERKAEFLSSRVLKAAE